MTETEAALREIAEDVYKDLGSGHDEKVYHRAMEVDLRMRGIEYDSERVLELRYKEHYVGENYADLVVGSGSDTIVVELKAATCKMGAPEEQQLRKYMRILGMEKGLLINFPQLQKRTKKDEEMKPEVLPVTQREIAAAHERAGATTAASPSPSFS